MDNREYINELLDRNFERIDKIAELEDRIEKLIKMNKDLADAKHKMHMAYNELEVDLQNAEKEIEHLECKNAVIKNYSDTIYYDRNKLEKENIRQYQEIKKLKQKIKLKDYIIDKISRAIMLISK